MESEICNFADDTTIYACDTSIEAVMTKLESDVYRLMKWFQARRKHFSIGGATFWSWKFG